MFQFRIFFLLSYLGIRLGRYLPLISLIIYTEKKKTSEFFRFFKYLSNKSSTTFPLQIRVVWKASNPKKIPTGRKSIYIESCFLLFYYTRLSNVSYRCRFALRHRFIKLRLYLEDFQFSDFQQYRYDDNAVLNNIRRFLSIIGNSIEIVSGRYLI